MRLLYFKYLTYVYEKKGKKDCLSHNNDEKKLDRQLLFFSDEMLQYVDFYLTNYNYGNKYSALRKEDIDGVITFFNRRMAEITSIFHKLNEEIIIPKYVFLHWIVIVLLFFIDGILTRSVLDVIFFNLSGYEISIIIVGFFVIVLAIVVNKIGVFIKKKNIIRWPLLCIVFLIFILLTFIRIYGIRLLQDDIGADGSLISLDDILAGLLFLSIYILTGFVGIYYGFKDSYKNDYIKSIEREYWERFLIVNEIKKKKNKYAVICNSYNKGWLIGKHVIDKNQKKENDTI